MTKSGLGQKKRPVLEKQDNISNNKKTKKERNVNTQCENIHGTVPRSYILVLTLANLPLIDHADIQKQQKTSSQQPPVFRFKTTMGILPIGCIS